MDESFEYVARGGNLTLSALAFAGLVLLAVQLWPAMPGPVALVAGPALALCLYQMVVTPVFGLRLTRSSWEILAGSHDQKIDSRHIAHLRLQQRGPVPHTILVLTDGSELEIPQQSAPPPIDLVREATRRGIPVRSD